MEIKQPTVRESLGDFYHAMSLTARAAADLASRPDEDHAALTRASLFRTLRSVEQLADALVPHHPHMT